MVRLKTRYILFQLRYPEQGNIVETGLANEIPSESSNTLTNKILASTLRLSMSKNFGDRALSDTLTSFVIKYFSNKTSTGILRVHYDAVETILAAMFFVQTLEGRNVIWESVGISGSISKCERRAILRNKRMIRKLKNEGKIKDENIESLIENFTENDIIEESL
jgi:ribonuclease P/MRP protein subunit POP5